MPEDPIYRRMNSWQLSRRRFLAGVAASSGAAVLGQLGRSNHPGAMSLVASGPARLSLLDAFPAVLAPSLSPVELTRACLERIACLGGRGVLACL